MHSAKNATNFTGKLIMHNTTVNIKTSTCCALSYEERNFDKNSGQISHSTSQIKHAFYVVRTI